jgi:hypothetical protein
LFSEKKSDENHAIPINGKTICLRGRLNPISATVQPLKVVPIFAQKISPIALFKVIIPALANPIAIRETRALL